MADSYKLIFITLTLLTILIIMYYDKLLILFEKIEQYYNIIKNKMINLIVKAI